MVNKGEFCVEIGNARAGIKKRIDDLWNFESTIRKERLPRETPPMSREIISRAIGELQTGWFSLTDIYSRMGCPRQKGD